MSLYDLVTNRECMNEEDAAYVIKRVATAVSHMHSMGYMHFDL